MTDALGFYFFPGSTYTYLTVSRIDERAAECGVAVNWRPYNLRALLQETGVAPFPPGTAKRQYMFRDLERRANRIGVPFVSEPPYPVDPELTALRIALVAADEGWCPEYMKAYYRAWFIDQRPPGMEEYMRPFFGGLGRDADAVLARAQSDEFTCRVDDSADEGRRLGLFGSPHFVVGTELFWGDDRLEDALEWTTKDGPNSSSAERANSGSPAIAQA